MIAYVEHLRTNLQVKRIMELERSANADVLLESAEASNKITWRISLSIPLRGKAKGWIDSIDPPLKMRPPGNP